MIDPIEPTSPQSSLDSDMSATTPCHRFPWRIIPVVLLYVYGGLVAASSIWFVLISLWGCMLTHDPQHSQHVYDMSESQRYFMALGMVLFGCHGCFAVVSGRYLWKRRWWRSAAAFAGAFVFVLLMYLALWFVGQQPPGRQVTCVPILDGPVAESRTGTICYFR
jgi:hypothetical protein